MPPCGFRCILGATPCLRFGSSPRRWKLHAGASRLRQADRDRLIGRACAVLAFTDVVHFLADELARLRRWRLAGALVCASAFDRFLLGHTCPPRAEFTQPECHVDAERARY